MCRFIVKCDVSGIQNFIFDVPSDGAARQLKARSFRVIAITEIAYRYLVDKFSNDEGIYKGGGNFYAYFEAEENSLKQAIKEFQKEFFTESLFPIFAFVQTTGNFKEDMEKVAEKANLAKFQRPFQTEPLFFKPHASSQYEDFSEKLFKSEGFIIEKKTDTDNPFSKGGCTFILKNDQKQFKDKILNKIPKNKSDRITDFSEIAQKATGDKKIAALTIDVDNLNSLFRNKERDEYKNNSESLTCFFEEKSYQILKEDIDNELVYPLFAGGDDFFLIGAWSKILEIAVTINEEFSSFADKKGFSNTTLSAGVVIVSPKFPTIRMAEEAENALKTAKNNGKNGICVFGEVLKWEDFKKAKEIALKLKEFVDKDELPRNLLHRLQSSELGFTSLQEQKAGKINFPRVHRLMYYLRNVEKDSEVEKYLKVIFEEYKNALLKNFLKKAEVNPALYVVAARWAEMLTKSQNDSENKD